MKTDQELVQEFHEAFNLPVRDTPDVGSPAERVLRVRLMLEEVLEFAKAARVKIVPNLRSDDFINSVDDLVIWDSIEDPMPDLTQMAHELADIAYVTNGTAVQLGIPLRQVLNEVHAANMRKVGPDGKAIVDERGKVQKPPGWRPADVAGVLARSHR